MVKPVKRIGILTGGGDCPGLNAVIRAVVKSARHGCGMDVVGFLDGYALDSSPIFAVGLALRR